MLSNHPNCLGGNGPSASSDLIGDVDGPASATDNAVARFDGTTGKLIQNSTVTIDDTGNITPSGSVHGANGSAANPSFSFNSNQNTGLYRIGANNIGVAANGSKVLDIATTGLTVTGALGASSLTSPAATNLTLAAGGTNQSVVLTPSGTGGVGIGTVTPAAKLEIAGTYADESSERTPATVEKLSVIVGGGGDGATYFKTGWSNSANSGIFTVGVGYFSSGSQVRDVITLRGSTGDVSIPSSTAGSAGAGALVVTGGLATGAASYLGGNTTVNGEFRANGIRLENGTFIAFGSADGEGMTGSQSANSLTLRTNSTTALTINSAQAATFAGAVTAPSAVILDAAAATATVLTVRTQNSTTYTSSVLTVIGDRGTTDSTYNLINANNNVISGQFLVRDSGNVVNTNNSYGAISDIRFKENIVDATSKLEKLNQVRIVNFNRIGNEQKQLGVIAQELEQIFPSMIEVAIDRDAEGNDLGTTTKAVKYSVFVPMLIKAVQELTARLAVLEAK